MKNKRQNKHLQLEANQCSVQGCKNKEDSCFIDECTLQNKEDWTSMECAYHIGQSSSCYLTAKVNNRLLLLDL